MYIINEVKTALFQTKIDFYKKKIHICTCLELIENTKYFNKHTLGEGLND